jgi:hypothetical protein
MTSLMGISSVLKFLASSGAQLICQFGLLKKSKKVIIFASFLFSYFILFYFIVKQKLTFRKGVVKISKERSSNKPKQITMKKLGLGILIFILVLGVFNWAGARMLLPVANQAKDRASIENSPVIKKTDDHLVLTPPGLEKIVFIHYKKKFAKPPWAGGKKEPSCYDFLGKWAKWQDLPINYVVGPDNPFDLSKEFIAQAILNGAQEWDSHTSSGLFGNYSFDNQASWDSEAPDGRNELLFGDYPEEGVIAVTVVWGYFSGPPSQRKIVEFDVLFDTDYLWGDADSNNDGIIDNSEVMDLQNIATHEIGHGLGLDDIYESACQEVTMYGYSDLGEIKKRTLEAPDITGLQELYGE